MLADTWSWFFEDIKKHIWTISCTEPSTLLNIGYHCEPDKDTQMFFVLCLNEHTEWFNECGAYIEHFIYLRNVCKTSRRGWISFKKKHPKFPYFSAKKYNEKVKILKKYAKPGISWCGKMINPNITPYHQKHMDKQQPTDEKDDFLLFLQRIQ